MADGGGKGVASYVPRRLRLLDRKRLRRLQDELQETERILYLLVGLLDEENRRDAWVGATDRRLMVAAGTRLAPISYDYAEVTSFVVERSVGVLNLPVARRFRVRTNDILIRGPRLTLRLDRVQPKDVAEKMAAYVEERSVHEQERAAIVTREAPSLFLRSPDD